MGGTFFVLGYNEGGRDAGPMFPFYSFLGLAPNSSRRFSFDGAIMYLLVNDRAQRTKALSSDGPIADPLSVETVSEGAIMMNDSVLCFFYAFNHPLTCKCKDHASIVWKSV